MPCVPRRIVSEHPPQNPAEQEWEGDYRPASAGGPRSGRYRRTSIRCKRNSCVQLADTLNTTLDLKTLLERTASLVRAVIDYHIFAILLINDRTHDLRMRFQIGHKPEVERMRIRWGRASWARWRRAATPCW